MSVIPTRDRDDPDFDHEALLEAISTLNGSRIDPEKLTGPLLVAYRRLLVRGIRSPYFPHEQMHAAFDEMRIGAPLLRLSGTPQPGVRILAPSYCGKSVGARDYVRRVKAQPGTSPYSVVYAKLDADGSVGSLATDILRALGEKRPESLAAESRWARARRCLQQRGVDLLILDEFQRAGRRVTIHPVILSKLIEIMDGDEVIPGQCSVAFIGKTEAKAIFKATGDMGNRLDAPVKLGRLLWAAHSEEFMQFAADFDQKLVDLKVTTGLAGLGSPALAEPLLEAANGTIGQFCRIVETAVIAITRAGRGLITRLDLSNAVQDWSIGNERIAKNPLALAAHGETIAHSRATRKTARAGGSLPQLGNTYSLGRDDEDEEVHGSYDLEQDGKFADEGFEDDVDLEDDEEFEEDYE